MDPAHSVRHGVSQTVPSLQLIRRWCAGAQVPFRLAPMARARLYITSTSETPPPPPTKKKEKKERGIEHAPTPLPADELRRSRRPILGLSVMPLEPAIHVVNAVFSSANWASSRSRSRSISIYLFCAFCVGGGEWGGGDVYYICDWAEGGRDGGRKGRRNTSRRATVQSHA